MKFDLNAPIFSGKPGDHAKGAAERFAREHWPEPREIESWDGDTFKLKDGTKVYEVRLAPGQRYGIYETGESK